jgi:simple sugar transport system permease protein
MEPAAGLLEAAVRIALPLLLVVIGEIVAERSGVLNIGLEGMILAGAFGGFAGAWATGSPWAGMLVGAAAGVALAALFAQLVIRWALDPIVSGVALNILSLGATGVLFRALTEGAGGTVFVATFAPWPVPGLAELPLVGPALFRLNAPGYATVALAAAAAVFLGRTAPGLILRAAGENPDAVQTAGVDVARVRTLAVLFCGLTAGAAGAYLSCGYSDTFVENMSAGRGFVALAIVVFARWSPLGGAAGALLFGLATSLQVRLQGTPVLGVEIPYQFFQMLPYALTLIVLASTSRRGAGAPAALARPWRTER